MDLKPYSNMVECLCQLKIILMLEVGGVCVKDDL